MRRLEEKTWLNSDKQSQMQLAMWKILKALYMAVSLQDFGCLGNIQIS